TAGRNDRRWRDRHATASRQTDLPGSSAMRRRAENPERRLQDEVEDRDARQQRIPKRIPRRAAIGRYKDADVGARIKDGDARRDAGIAAVSHEAVDGDVRKPGGGVSDRSPRRRGRIEIGGPPDLSGS